jgi:hypothetical protein
MNTREYYELFRYLMQKRCLKEEDIVFVENIAQWCKEQGIPEPDRDRPFKLLMKDGQGCKMLIREDLPDNIIDERIRAVSIRNQISNVASGKTDMLDTPHRKLAFLFLNEYAYSLPEVVDDLHADNWAFEEMERLGYFKNENEGLKQA